MLVRKIEQTQKRDGSWWHVWDANLGHEGAANAPMLGHALNVWAIESAARRGVKVDRDVILRARQYAMSDAAERHEWKTNAAWRTLGRKLAWDGKIVPRWGRAYRLDGGADDPVNYELYLMAGRLAVLHQTDASNQLLVREETRKLSGRSTPADLARLRDLRATADRSRAVLEQGRQYVREGWIKIHKRDRVPSPAPLFFAGEDFLSTLLMVNSMADGKDVEQWFIHVAQRLMYFQDFNGGLKTDQHVKPGELPTWPARDKPFMTAVALYVLTADTPYREVVLGHDARRSIGPLEARPPQKGKPQRAQ